MAETLQDLKLKNDPSTIVRPNIVAGNIPSGAIDSTKLATGAVTASKIGAGAVQSSNIATGAVNTAAVEDGAIDSNKLASGAVTAVKIGSRAVGKGKLKILTAPLSSCIQESTTVATLATALQNLFENDIILSMHAYTSGDVYNKIDFVEISQSGISYYFGTSLETIGNDTQAAQFWNDDAPRIDVVIIEA